MNKYLLVLMLTILFVFCGCSDDIHNKKLPVQIKSDLDTDIPLNPFFFPDKTNKEYNAKFTFLDTSLPDNIKLTISEVLCFESGVLYELRIDCDNDFSGRDNNGWDRFQIGYFYVQEKVIYLLRGQDIIESIKSEEDIIKLGTIVCQNEEMEDTLHADELGWHEYILVNDNQCEYHSYNNLTETGFYESFTWEYGKGLVEYRSGFGAESEGIELQLISDAIDSNNSGYKIKEKTLKFDHANFLDYSEVKYPHIELSGDDFNDKELEEQINETLFQMAMLHYDDSLENEMNAFYDSSYDITYADEKLISFYFQESISSGSSGVANFEDGVTISLVTGNMVSIEEFGEPQDLMEKVYNYKSTIFTDGSINEEEWKENKKELIAEWLAKDNSIYHGYYITNEGVGFIFNYYNTGREKMSVEFVGIIM